MPSLPRRDSFFATSLAGDWETVKRDLVEYWVKVAEILPRYYGGRAAPDPLAGETDVSPDLGWDRLVFLLDPVYGNLTTNLWVDSQEPQHSDRVWVIVKFRMIEEMSAGNAKQQRSLPACMRTALADAAALPAAAQAVAQLQRWREMSFWVMDAENAETLRPLSTRCQ